MPSPSSSGPGHRVFIPATGVRFPLGTPTLSHDLAPPQVIVRSPHQTCPRDRCAPSPGRPLPSLYQHAQEELVEPGRCFELVAPAIRRKGDPASQHPLQHRAALGRRLPQQPPPFRQPVLHYVRAQSRHRLKTAEVAVDGHAAGVELLHLRDQ